MPASRYLSSQKLSDYQIEKILAAYSKRIKAHDFARAQSTAGLNRKTIYAIYDLVRRRLLDIGYYQEPEEYYRFWMSDEERAGQFMLSETAQRIAAEEPRMRGASSESARYILAEIIFQAESDLAHEAFLKDLKLAVRITGHLNRPPVNVDVWRERAYILELDRQITALRLSRKPSKAFNAQQIERLERVRSQADRTLREKLRSRGLRGSVLPGHAD